MVPVEELEPLGPVWVVHLADLEPGMDLVVWGQGPVGLVTDQEELGMGQVELARVLGDWATGLEVELAMDLGDMEQGMHRVQKLLNMVLGGFLVSAGPEVCQARVKLESFLALDEGWARWQVAQEEGQEAGQVMGQEEKLLNMVQEESEPEQVQALFQETEPELESQVVLVGRAELQLVSQVQLCLEEQGGPWEDLRFPLATEPLVCRDPELEMEQ